MSSPGDLLVRFSSYIYNRKQAGLTSNYIFSWVPILALQGSLLGPLLFVNNIELFQNVSLCFADEYNFLQKFHDVPMLRPYCLTYDIDSRKSGI